MWKHVTHAATALALAALAVVIWYAIIIPALIGWSVLLHATGAL